MMILKLISWTVAPICLGVISGCTTNNHKPQTLVTPTEPIYSVAGQNGYRWANVSIGGGGFVTGVYPHSLQKDHVYLKTDIGGFYRWNPENKSWIPITDHFPLQQKNYYGGEALAVDPNNPNVVYIATGKYTGEQPKGTIFKSSDRGKNWIKLNIDLPMGGNEDQRWSGERLAVNPFNSKIILFGSRKDGLWKSLDAGTTWSKIPSFPQTFKAGIGIVSIVFDKQVSGLVYANVYGDGIYKSTDTGVTWSKMTGSPTQAQRMAAANNGTLYVTHMSGVSKYANGVWSKITPDGKPASFNALAVNPANLNNVVVALGQSTSPKIYGSLDGGGTWTEKRASANPTVPWHNPKDPFAVWTSAIEFDPKVPGKVWLTYGFGTWQTDNINADPVVWTNYVQGLEETVSFTLLAPPKGPVLLSGMADVNGFYHDNGVNAYPSKTFSSSGPADMHTFSLAYSESDPLRLVRVGGTEWNSTYSGATSTNGGLTWTKFKEWTVNKMPLRVAVSATNPNLFVVTVSEDQPLRTTDGGASWSSVSGLPNAVKGPWYWSQPLAADKVDGNTFYYYSEGKVYRSTDGGASFNVVNSSLPSNDPWCDPNNDGFCVLKTVPGVKGEVWLSLGWKGLFHSTDSGKTFTRLPTVERAFLFALGKPQTGSTTPAMYLYGKLTGIGEGIFRSLDRGQTWISIGATSNPIGTSPNVMEASLQQFGLVFIGTDGRGIYYGTPHGSGGQTASPK
jgi:photosystem II stability/assembly factor-like uncharacterized protein